MGREDFMDDTETLSHSEYRLDEPSLFKVVLLNDDFTPMDFVVELIMKFFQKSLEEATNVMLNIHHEGVGVCGIYPRDIAETKVMQVNRHARNSGHPLRCRLEEH